MMASMLCTSISAVVSAIIEKERELISKVSVEYKAGGRRLERSGMKRDRWCACWWTSIVSSDSGRERERERERAATLSTRSLVLLGWLGDRQQRLHLYD